MPPPLPAADQRSSTSGGLASVEEARAAILAGVAPPSPQRAERVAPAEALGRVLAADLEAGLSMPRWPNSAMDGYALRLDDVTAAGDAGLPVSQYVAAGTAPGPLPPATAARIFTGAPLPAGADTVVMQEHCRRVDERVCVERLPGRGANIRAAGEDFAAGAVVLRAGCTLGPQHIALAASAGAAVLPVHRRLRVAVRVTGDELMPPGAALGDGQIHESNGHMLAALAARLGAEVGSADVVPDDRGATARALAEAAAGSDLVVTSGGVSVGEADHVRAAIEALGELGLFGVAVKPGKPLAFGRIGGTPLLALPGNPVSLFVTFVLFGAPLLRRLQGRAATMPEPLQLPAGFERTRAHGRAEYLRVRLDDGRIRPHGDQGSGILSSIAAAHGLALVPPHTAVAAGDPLAYFPMDALLY